MTDHSGAKSVDPGPEHLSLCRERKRRVTVRFKTHNASSERQTGAKDERSSAGARRILGRQAETRKVEARKITRLSRGGRIAPQSRRCCYYCCEYSHKPNLTSSTAWNESGNGLRRESSTTRSFFFSDERFRSHERTRQNSHWNDSHDALHREVFEQRECKWRRGTLRDYDVY